MAALPGLVASQESDGAWHALWCAQGRAQQLWLTAPPSGEPAAYVVILPLDALFALRVEAALRLWRAASGAAPAKSAHDLPPQTRERHVLILRALDARQEGASFRQIGEALLGFRGGKADWESHPARNTSRRLVADGVRYMRGRYRDLLRYPIRPPRRR